MSRSIIAKLEKLERVSAPKSEVRVVWAEDATDVERLRESHNTIAQGDMYILGWLPPQE